MEDHATDGAIEEWEVLDILSRLVDKSLIIYEAQQGGPGRYQMLGLARQYAADRLLETGEADEVRRRHLDYFVRLVEEIESRSSRALDQAWWFDRLDPEHDNVRSALAWCAGNAEEDPEVAGTGLRLAGAFSWFWYMHGFLTEGRAYIDRMLAQTPDAPPSARAKALTGAGYIGYFLGDRAGALAQLEEGVDVARESGDRWHLAIALNLLGNICLYEGDVARTRALAEEGLAVSREQGNETFTAFSIFLLGFLALLASDLERAEALLEESTAVWRRLGNRQFFANALVRLGEVKLRQGRLDAARAHYAESLACAAEMRFMVTIIRCLYGLAGVWAARGEVGRAARLLGATEAHVKAMQVAMPPSERAAVDRHVAALRAGMGEEAFEAAYTEGGRMSLDETLAFAVEDEAPAG